MCESRIGPILEKEYFADNIKLGKKKRGEYAAMTNLAIYIQNRNLTNFKTEWLSSIYFITKQSRLVIEHNF